MNGWDRFKANTLAEKLDRNLITLAEAKRYAPELKDARSKKEFIRRLWGLNRTYADSLGLPMQGS